MKVFKCEIFVLLLVLMPFTLLKAQVSEIGWGEFIEVPLKNKAGLIFMGANETHYWLRLDVRKLSKIFTYDIQTGKLVKEEELDISFWDDKYSNLGIVSISSKRYLMYEEYNGKKSTRTLWARPFENGKLNEAIKIHTYDYKRKKDFSSQQWYTNEDYNGYLVSEDRTKLLLISSASSKEEGKPEEFMIAVFDSDFNKIWEKKQTFELKDNKFKLRKVRFSNAGKIYFLADIEKNRNEIKSERKAKKFFSYKKTVLFELSENDIHSKEVLLEENMLPSKITISFLNEDVNKLVLTGYFSLVDEDGNQGTFCMFYEDGLKNEIVKYHTFSDEWIRLYQDSDDLDKKNGISSNFGIQTFFQFDNGDFGFVSEERNSIPPLTKYSNIQTVNGEYVVVAIFKINGELVRHTKIQKNYIFGSGALVHSLSFIHENKLMLIHNEKLSKEDKQKLNLKGKNTSINLCAIDDSGMLLYEKELFRFDGTKIRFSKYFFNKQDDRILIGVKKSFRKFKIGTFSFL